ncbi:hypothetical protein EaACW_2406 [Erwinia amylovora ACW56400]|uniref:Uncharacterized protein n=3 Tax=Erwinia amylovora TaxID=552 RepID=A0A831A0V3_ERWAM|nr:hypothetical protein EaACW_2406 [Erwinia amylovora ACW56400]CBA21623.1 hypothetical protein predicted by Glimmer/Critica [Erwinia amylovora CFBP1430]CBX81270.1 hypothetical protein predicted by Glimmer/Critica [Erwinia amylovora ATCC BAA-2158]CCO79252.1 hypothetical protein BN432_2465 [Erwinia amylovora Ea356]CCO83057.1 hypothetical protein BN433_2497 [Erwinia amylovora Ea266]CCO86820.1 hypothetical protein BN434_2442 [Erwinia amylovora CFBP 2585]CCO90614.1 hypothetical protein BN435_2455 
MFLSVTLVILCAFIALERERSCPDHGKNAQSDNM